MREINDEVIRSVSKISLTGKGKRKMKVKKKKKLMYLGRITTKKKKKIKT